MTKNRVTYHATTGGTGVCSRCGIVMASIPEGWVTADASRVNCKKGREIKPEGDVYKCRHGGYHQRRADGGMLCHKGDTVLVRSLAFFPPGR